MKTLTALLILISTLPATAQSARQFLFGDGRPVSRGTLTLYRLGEKRTVKLDKDGFAKVQLDFRESYIALRDHKGHFVASYSVIGTRLNALSCAGLACLPDQKPTADYFPVRKP